jgi:hypothetical protein
MKQEMHFKKFIFDPNLPRLSDDQTIIENSAIGPEDLGLVRCSICKNNYDAADFCDSELCICYMCEKNNV